ncbi:VCBS repeat-containing protein [Enterovibrio sp. ZSDZ35]|uniref:VCBS repeat-containing protein n=1 Tax=Enterovibrio qingdaonensis TaxID=2899818 RepID=A0ABT5QH96_9GAMM|nr:VCBS repeat-containing protein [Enterovibrio sp. ZSDZ35]MDD1780355.1 VCBS repeat-containing protein [Enterovibrio sp. ZSDZ35]
MKTSVYIRRLGAVSLLSLLAACGGGSGDSAPDTSLPSKEIQTRLTPEFAAVFSQKVAAQSSQRLDVSRDAVVRQDKQDQRFVGELEVTNVSTQAVQTLDWSVTLRADGTVDSHGTITLTPGVYDFVLMLARNGNQYVAQSLAQEVTADGNFSIDLTLLPNLGDTIVNIEDVDYLSTMTFEYPSSDLAAFTEPKFGMSLNAGDELIFDINKDVGVAEVTVNVDAGEYQLGLNFYEGRILVGQNTGNTQVNLGNNEDVVVDIIPLQADIDFTVERVTMNGEFVFNVPAVIVNEVGGEENVSLVVRLNAGNNPVQEKALTVVDTNGEYSASDNFATHGESSLTAFLAFYDASAALNAYSDAPYASCSTTISVETLQVLGCKLELARNSVVSGRLLSTLMLNVATEDGAPATGAEVYLNDKLVGLTGASYQSGSLKTHQVAGDYALKVEKANFGHTSALTLAPLSVVNKRVTLIDQGAPTELAFVDSGQQLVSVDPRDTVIADMNNDGHLDVIEVQFYNDPASDTEGTLIWINDGTGQFTTNHVVSYGRENAAAVGNIFGSGHLDLVLSAWTAARVYRNDGTGSFQGNPEISLKPAEKYWPVDMEMADLFGTGNLDLVFSDGTSMGYFANEGNQSFVEKDMPGWSMPCGLNKSISDFALADLNNDGILDVAVTCSFNANESAPKQAVLLLDSEGSANVVDIEIPTGEGYIYNYTSLAVGDLNHDGFKDIVYGRANRPSLMYFNNGDGTFRNGGEIDTTEVVSAYAVSLVDMNNDGNLDIILSTLGSDHQNRIFFTDEKGAIYAEKPILTQGGTLHPGDFNGDGKIDFFQSKKSGVNPHASMHLNVTQ